MAAVQIAGHMTERTALVGLFVSPLLPPKCRLALSGDMGPAAVLSHCDDIIEMWFAFGVKAPSLLWKLNIFLTKSWTAKSKPLFHLTKGVDDVGFTQDSKPS
jgi:hypothetical protein